MFRRIYIPPEILKNMEEPSKEGRLLMGVLGSFAGAMVIMFVSAVLWLCDLRFGWNVEIGYFVLPLFIGYMAGWGYRLFGGLRSVPAAFIVVAGVTQLSSVVWLLGLFAFAAYDATKASSLPLGFLYSSLAGLMPEFWQEYGDGLLIYEILILVGVMAAGGALFRYADWKNTPWRTAVHSMKRQGYNLLPEQFRVGGRLSVKGENFRVLPNFKKEHSFTVRDIIHSYRLQRFALCYLSMDNRRVCRGWSNRNYNFVHFYDSGSYFRRNRILSGWYLQTTD